MNMHDALSFRTRVTIAPGVDMPRLGFGTYKSAEGPEVEHAVAEALRLGYRGVDTASIYGNEAGVGRAIRASGVARKGIFVTTKVWNSDQGYARTLEALERSLERLGFEYVDLYLVHWYVPGMLRGTWRAMEEALAVGKARAIGVCNFLPHHLDELLSMTEVPPAVDQVEFHPRLQQPGLQRYLAEHDITLQAWAPLMRGRAGEVPELAEIASRHGVSASQVCVRWILQLGHTTIPKSTHDERIAQNADVFGFELTAEEMATIATLDTGMRLGPDPNTGPSA